MKTFRHLWYIVFLLPTIALCGGTLRIMTYNLLNYPGTDAVTRDPNFRKIVYAARPDILVAQEVQSQAGVDNFRTNVMNFYQPDLYVSVPFHDGYDTDNALFYDSSKVSFIRATYIPTTLRDIAEYVLKPRWSDESFRIYSVHLKASNTTSDRQDRLNECTILRNYLNGLPTGTNFIIVGDYNIYTSSEPAYQMLTASSTDNDGRAKDPLNMSGTWNNSAYALYHTQSTRSSAGGLDDRFDMILPSYPMYSTIMITNSYKAYGNDGYHYNRSVNALPNYAVPDSVANALYVGSDHLPVMCDFSFPDSLAGTMMTMNVRQGWNLISLPLNVYTSAKIALFPSATSNAYYYNQSSGLLWATNLQNWLGYWLKFDADEEITITGKPRFGDTVNVTTGWNFIGTAGFDIPVSEVIVQPDSIFSSAFFGFDGRHYRVADTLKRGGAYFIKATQNGKIILQ